MVESSTCRNSAAFIILSRLGAKKRVCLKKFLSFPRIMNLAVYLNWKIMNKF